MVSGVRVVRRGASLALAVLVAGCVVETRSGSSSPPPPPPPATMAPPPGSPPPGGPGPGALAPGPAPMGIAPSCQRDGQCGFARCNTRVGRCAFPCGSNADCMTGSTCLMAGTPAAVCSPPLPGAAP